MGSSGFQVDEADAQLGIERLGDCVEGRNARRHVPTLEVASTNEDLRRATSAVFDDWVARASTRLAQHGVSPDDAPRLARTLIMLLEGAFLSCRAGRTAEPMAEAQVVAVAEVRRVLA